MPAHWIVVALCTTLAIALTTSPVAAKPRDQNGRPLLRGVTIRNWPYADRLSERYEGFIVDLMNLISEHVGFSYQLYFSPDGKYGSEFKGFINGMIGEVYRNKADFAIADLTVTEARKRFVDFTEPFLENQLSAIIRKEDAVGLRTLEDLVHQSVHHSLGTEGSYPNSKGTIAFGTYKTGSTYYHLSRSKDPVAVRMYNWMLRNPTALVTSAKEGFDRVNAGRYAFIVESTFAEYLTGLYCNLTTLYDTRSLYNRQFAIALPKGSKYLDKFNEAIRELKASGAIEKLRIMYWANRCSANLPNITSNDIPPIRSVQPSPPAQPVQPIPSQPSPPIVQQPRNTKPSISVTRKDNNNSNETDINNNTRKLDPGHIQWSVHQRHRSPPPLRPPPNVDPNNSEDKYQGGGFYHPDRFQRPGNYYPNVYSSASSFHHQWTLFSLLLGTLIFGLIRARLL